MNHHDQETLLNVENLHVSFKGENKQWIETVKGISFSIPKNKTVALVGESGSGKSVTSLAIMGLLPKGQSQIATQSRITFEDKDLLNLSMREIRNICGKEIAMIFQEPMSSLNPVFTVGDQIAEVLRIHLGMGRKQARARVLELLKEVGIPSPETKIDAYPSQLSGGQQQRIMIAMAIACEPKLLIADEPTTAMEAVTQAQIFRLLYKLNQLHNTTILLLSNNFASIRNLSDHITLIYCGQTVESGSYKQITENPMHPYTQSMIKTILDFNDALEHKSQLYALPGYIPTSSELPTGCRLGPRCPKAQRACVTKPENQHYKGHMVRCHFPTLPDKKGQ